MFFKNWPYWLKGGIAFVGVIIVLMILIYVFAPDVNCFGKGLCNNLPYWQYPVSLILTAIAVLIETLTGNGIGSSEISTWMFFPNNLIFLSVYFLIGAIIGLIYGKIKNRITK